MDRSRLHIVFVILLCQATAFAQLDSIQELPEVFLSDTKLVHFSKGFKLEKLKDSVVKRNPASLTNVLRYNSAIYFKENGSGMVSSPSLRGTNAAQTAVIWNGININSVFTGQTDFNIISPFDYDEISIRSGGGGVQYGSGAVGGSIHLNNNFSFDETDKTIIGLRSGSFSTLGGNVSSTNTWNGHYLNIGVDFISSENDYDYVGKNKKNLHGEFLRFTAKVNDAQKIKRGMITWNSEYSYNDRNFSGSLNTIGRDSYKDIATRNLWQLHQKFGKFKTVAKVAHLFENFRYYPDSEKPNFSQGRANTFLGALETEILVQNKIRLNGKLDYTLVKVDGDNVGKHERKTLSAVVLLNHKLTKNFNYGVNFRQEISNDYENPLLFSVDANFKVSKYYALRLNGSKNYRVPTFNDLYWYAGGNFELEPETSYQVELGQELSFGKLRLDLATYYISSENLIKWVPASGSLWRPSNISQTKNLGLEAKASYAIQIRDGHKMELQALYSYTQAKDLDMEKQLIYVPFHKANAFFSYKNKHIVTYLQGLYTGTAFTTTDNSEIVGASTIYDFGMEYFFSKNPSITVGGSINNIFNTYYENVSYRPMPSRSFQIFLNFNI